MSSVSASEIQRLFESVFELAIKPVVMELSEETGQPISLKAVALRSGPSVSKVQCMRAERAGGGATASGEARVILKDAGYPCSFLVEAIFDDLSPGSGFSGFSMRGKVKLENGRPFVKLTARTNRYNVKEWSREFRGV